MNVDCHYHKQCIGKLHQRMTRKHYRHLLIENSYPFYITTLSPGENGFEYIRPVFFSQPSQILGGITCAKVMITHNSSTLLTEGQTDGKAISIA